MAAAASADPAVRATRTRTRRARVACNWAAKLFVVEDHVDASRYSAGSERCTVELFGICEEDAGDDVYDLATWSRLDYYIRGELQLPSDGSLVLTLQHEALGPQPHHVTTKQILFCAPESRFAVARRATLCTRPARLPHVS